MADPIKINVTSFRKLGQAEDSAMNGNGEMEMENWREREGNVAINNILYCSLCPMNCDLFFFFKYFAMHRMKLEEIKLNCDINFIASCSVSQCVCVC